VAALRLTVERALREHGVALHRQNARKSGALGNAAAGNEQHRNHDQDSRCAYSHVLPSAS
jgi:hypothetical protein